MTGYQQQNILWQLLFVFVSILQIVFCATVSNLEAEYDHSAWLEPNEIYKLHWSVNHADKSIKFAAEVKTTGWIGFGISKGLTGKMLGADIVIGWVDSAGKGFLKDCHGTGHSRPSEDVKQDYTLSGSSQNSSWTVLKFKRYLNTCDNNTDNEIKTGTTRVIFAWNAGDPAGNLHSNLAFHGYGINRGSRSMNLLNYVKNTKVPEGVPYFDILQKNIKVPAKTTTYWCSPFKISDLVKLNSTKHVIEMGTIIQPRLEGLVHHILLYACKDNFDPAHLNITGECYGSMPSSIRECAGGTAIFAWAIGGNNFKFPANTGYPIGSLKSVKYVVMETHFDNPGKRSDFVDTSGFRFYYTEPRKYDAAILTTGSVVGDNMVIPPNRTDWNIVGDCPKECSQKMGKHNLAPFGDSVKIFAAFPHAHTVGKAIKTVLVRNGSAIEEVIRDDNYDFDFQQTYVLKKEITFKPGDELKTTCTYDSRKRKYATVGGLATDDEMCLNFLFYYPSADFTNCATTIPYLRQHFTAKYANPNWYPGMNRSKPAQAWQLRNWTGVVWNSTMVNELKAFYDYRGAAITWTRCLGDQNRELFNGMIKTPQIKEQLPVPRDVCLDRTTKAPATSKRPTTHLTTRLTTRKSSSMKPTTKQPSTTRNRVVKPGSGATLSPIIILLPMSYICTRLFT